MYSSVSIWIWSICYVVVLLGLSAYGLHRYFILGLYWKHRKNRPQPLGRFEALPVVTVQLPIFNEYHVVRRLIESVASLRYPKEKLEIQVLDDSTDETAELSARMVEDLKSNGLDAKCIHRKVRDGYKAGALDNGLRQARGEFILILDADFIVSPDLLEQTIHYFTEPGIGMIQTRWGHINRDYSLLTRVQAMFLDGHLLLEQTARSRSGRFFNFNGTAGLWRRECINSAGGWHHDTLTEDLDLSYRAQLKGWRFVFLSDIVTPAELPVEMNGFKNQQHRWTKGSIQTCKKLLPRIWHSPLPFPIKIEATIHLTSNFAYLLLALLCVLIHPASGGPAFGPLRSILVDGFVFTAASLSALIYYLFAQRELHPKTWMRNALCFPMMLAVGIGLSLNNARAVLEAVFNYQSEFTRTPKYGIEGGGRQACRKGRYLPMKSLICLVEILFAGLFTWLVARALASGNYWGVPFLVLFQVGFTYVALLSLAPSLPRWNFTRGRRADGVPG